MSRGRMVVGLDLGTTKICAVIAEQIVAGGLGVIGVGSCPSDGLRRGVVVDVEKTVQSIKRAVEEAELMAGVEVGSVYAGIAGEHIGALDSRGIIAIGGQDSEVNSSDRERAVQSALAIAAVPIDREILHVLTQEFAVDGQRGIRDPSGMSGIRLEADVHIVTGAVTSAQNICKSILRAGIEVRDIVLESLASSFAVLGEDEKEMGVCLMDVGGGTTDLVLFHQGAVRHTAIVGLGGQNVTNDVAIGLRTSWPNAERIKCESGSALTEQVGSEEMVEVPGMGDREPQTIPRRQLGSIIEPRMEEIFTMVEERLQSYEGPPPSAGVVLTGGGALLDGAVELAEQVLRMPARLGVPRGVSGMTDRISSPIYATALGLVLFGSDNGNSGSGQARSSGLRDGKFENVLSRMKDWFQTMS